MLVLRAAEAGFCAPRMRCRPLSRPRWARRVRAASTGLPPVMIRSTTSSTMMTMRGSERPSRSRRSISSLRRARRATAESGSRAGGAMRCGSPASGPRPRALGSSRANCKWACRLPRARLMAMARMSSVLPEPVAPATSTCVTSGEGRRSSSGRPSSARPRQAVCAGSGERSCSMGSSGTGSGSGRGTSTAKSPPVRETRTLSAPRAKASSSLRLRTTLMRAPGAAATKNRSHPGAISPPRTCAGNRCEASTASMRSA